MGGRGQYGTSTLEGCLTVSSITQQLTLWYRPTGVHLHPCTQRHTGSALAREPPQGMTLPSISRTNELTVVHFYTATFSAAARKKVITAHTDVMSFIPPMLSELRQREECTRTTSSYKVPKPSKLRCGESGQGRQGASWGLAMTCSSI